MAVLALGLIGAAAGYWIGGTAVAASIGWAIGAYAGNALFGSNSNSNNQDLTQEGPRLSDLKIQNSTYGNMIPFCYGTVRVTGNLIWGTDIQETKHTNTQDIGGGGGGGGKGGGGGGGASATQTTITYTYAVNLAFAVCEGVIAGIRRIWANGNVIYDISESNYGLTTAFSLTGNGGQIRIYPGDEFQNPDGLIEAYQGASNVPAFRGTAYVVFENFQLANFGNSIPNFSFEVIKQGTFNTQGIRIPVAGSGWGIVYNPVDGDIYICDVFATGTVKRININTNSVVASASSTNLLFFVEWFYNPVNSKLYARTASAYYEVDTTTLLTKFAWDALAFAAPKFNGFPSDYINIADTQNQRLYGSSAGVVSTVVTSRLNVMDANNPSNDSAIFQYQWTNNPASLFVLDTTTGNLWGVDALVLTTPNSQIYNYNVWDGVGQPTPVLTLPFTTLGTAGAVSMEIDTQAYRLLVYYNGDSGNSYICKIDLDTETIISTTQVPKAAGGNPLIINIRERHCFYFHGAFQIIYFGLDDNSITTYAYPFASFTGIGGTIYDFNTDSELWVGNDGSVGQCVFRFIGNRINPSPNALSGIVEDLCTKVNLTSGDLDVTALNSIYVSGYYVANISTIRSCLQQLMDVFYFDAVESDGKIKFVLRGQAPALTIIQDKLAAHAEGGQLPDIVTITRAQELDLPRVMNVTYVDINNDYQTSTQYSRRVDKLVEKVQANQYPIVLDANSGKAVADTLLYEIWIARTVYDFATTLEYSKIEPTDVVTLNNNGALYNVRIIKKDQDLGVIKWQAVDEVPAIYTQSTNGAPSVTPDNQILFPSPTRLFYLDIPTLRDPDNGAGIYLAAAPSNPNASWKGATIMRSFDMGASFQEAISFFAGCTCGMSSTVLGNWTGGNSFDKKNKVTVMMIEGTLSDVTELQALNGMNLALLGNEIILFQEADLIATNTYVLSNILRGRFGTEQYQSTHSAPETFVLLDNLIRRYHETLQDINSSRLYRAITFGNNLFSAPNQTFTDTGVSLMPLSGVHLKGSRNISTLDLTITWIRRTRITGGWNDYVDVPLGEDTEAYEVDIYNGSNVVRTLTSTTPSVVYTAAEQVADFGSTQSSVVIIIYQMSASVGRGFGAQATV